MRKPLERAIIWKATEYDTYTDLFGHIMRRSITRLKGLVVKEGDDKYMKNAR